MRDRLGFSKWVNAPVRNPTQNKFSRFVKQPGSGLPDTLKEYRTKFDDFGKQALKTRLSEYLSDDY
jgi:hypothetical protein